VEIAETAESTYMSRWYIKSTHTRGPTDRYCQAIFRAWQSQEAHT